VTDKDQTRLITIKDRMKTYSKEDPMYDDLCWFVLEVERLNKSINDIVYALVNTRHVVYGNKTMLEFCYLHGPGATIDTLKRGEIYENYGN